MSLAAFFLSAVALGSTPDWLDHYLAGSRALEQRDHATARVELERGLELLPRHAGTAYQLACAHAVAGERDAALEWLTKAVEFGFNDAAVARWDADLASVLGDPRCEALLAPLRLRHVSPRPLPLIDARARPPVDVVSRDTSKATLHRAQLWDARTGERIAALERAGEVARSVAISPDGRLVALGGTRDDWRTNFVRVHDGVTGVAICELPAAMGHTPSVGFSVDNLRLVVTGDKVYAERATVWDTRTWSLVATVTTPDCKSATSSPRAKFLALVESPSGTRSNVVLWNVDTNALIARQDDRFSSSQVYARFTPDDARVALYSPQDPLVLVMDTRDGRLLQALFDLTRPHDAVFTHAGHGLWCAGRDGSLVLWDLDTAQIVRRIETHQRRLKGIALGETPETLRLETWDDETGLLDLRTETARWTRFRPRPFTIDAGTARAGRVGDDVFWLGGSDGSLRAIDRSTGRSRKLLQVAPCSIAALGISTCGRRVAALDVDDVLHVLDADDGTEVGRIESLTGNPEGWRGVAIEFSADDRTCALRDSSGAVHVLDTTSWTRVADLASDSKRACPFALSAERALIATTAGTGRVVLHSTRTGELVSPPLQVEGTVLSLAFEPMSSRLWIGTDKSRVEVLDTDTGKLVRRLEHGDLDDMDGETEIGSITFDRTGSRASIGTAGYGGIALWDVATSRRLWSFAYEYGANPSALLSAFSRDGAQLFVWGQMWSTGRVVETEHGHTVLDLADREVRQIVVAGDSLPAALVTRRGTELVRPEQTLTRIDYEHGGWILQADTGHVDGSREALDHARMQLTQGWYTLAALDSLDALGELDGLAAVIVDPKKVAARAAGIAVDGIAPIDVPTLDWSTPQPRVVVLATDAKEIELTALSQDARGILAFEVMRDGVRERIEAAPEPDDATRARWSAKIARPVAGAAVELRVRAIATSGVMSRPLRIAVAAQP